MSIRIGVASLIRLDEKDRRVQLWLALGLLILSSAAVFVMPRISGLTCGEIAVFGVFVVTGLFFTHQFGARGGPLAIGFLTLSVLVGVIGLPWQQGLGMVAGCVIAAVLVGAYAKWIQDIETDRNLRQTTETEKKIEMTAAQTGLADLQTKLSRQETSLKIWSSLVEVVHGCSATLKFDQLASFILRTVESLFPNDRVSLWISSSATPETLPEQLPPGRRFQTRAYEASVTDGLDRLAWEQQQNVMVQSQDGDFRFQGAGEYRFAGKSALVCPLMEENQVYGNLRVTAHEAERFNHEDMVILSHVAGVVSMSASNVRLYERTEELALTDGQTGLFKRFYFEKRFYEESKRALRKNHAMGLILFDIDHFKKINDTYGHAIGDSVLHEVGRIIREVNWGGALPCRWGGEEFLLALPDATADQARRRTETLMDQIKAQTFKASESSSDPRTFHVTVSAGVAVFPGDSGDPEQLFQIADRRMYRAKNSGRDRFVDHD